MPDDSIAAAAPVHASPHSGGQRQASHPWLTVLAVLCAASLTGLALDRYIGLTGQAMLYVLAIAIAADRLSWLPSAASAILAVPLLGYLFVPPRFALVVDSPEHLLSLAAMLTVALSISLLGTRLRRETDNARLNEWRARQLEGLATALGTTDREAQILALAQQALDRALPGPNTVVLLDAAGELRLPTGQTPDLPSEWRDGLAACIREGGPIGPGTGRWNDLEAWYLPLAAEQHVAGAARIPNATADNPADREHAQAICALAARTALRQKLASELRATEERARWQRAQNTFLAAISHDVRTPLATIMGAASSLRVQRDKLPGAEQDRLLEAIETEARHLSALTDNTLQLARLSHAGELRLDWESAEEIVGSVLGRLRLRVGGDRIRSTVPTNLPLLRADPVLLAQVTHQLATYLGVPPAALQTPPLLLAVHDQGDGVAPGEPGDAHPVGRGGGLGLTLCRAIARAHGGDLLQLPRAGQGSTFVLALPVPQQPPAEPPPAAAQRPEQR